MLDRIKKLPHSQAKIAVERLHRQYEDGRDVGEILTVAVESLEQKKEDWYKKRIEVDARDIVAEALRLYKKLDHKEMA